MAEATRFEQFLQKLATVTTPNEQAALVAESAFAQLDPAIALVAQRCIVLRWFDPLIVTDLLSAADATETSSAADDVTNQLAQLPFVERLPWGLTYHEQTRIGLLERYATEQPDLLRQAALLAAPAYQQHTNQALAGQEALYCWLVAGEAAKAQQLLDDLIRDAGRRADWDRLLALFATCDQAANLPFVAPLQPTAFHHFAQGVAFQQVGNQDDAVAAYQQAIALDDKYAYPWNNLGLVYYNQKRYDEAIDAYQQAIALDDKFATPWNNLGLVYYNQKRYEEAIDAYQQAIARDEKFATPWNGLGNVYRNQKRYDDAIVAYQQAIARDEKDASPRANLVIPFRLLERWSEAEASIRHALALEPTDSSLWCGLADVLRRRGDQVGWQEALAQAQPLVDYNDFYNAACFESVAGNMEQALALLAQAAAEAGFDADWAQVDPDLAWLRHDPRFAQIVKGA